MRQSPTAASGAADADYAAVYDRLFAQGRSAVLSGRHYRDAPPVDGGRWGLSVVFLPDGGSTERLAGLTVEAMDIAGHEHWPTGAPQAVHVTVRAIQVHRSVVPPEDPLEVRCAAALTRAAASAHPARLRLTGVTLTPSGVMACAVPVDHAADAFASHLGEELGADGWFEARYRRDIWYATLLHFTTDIRSRQGLVDWVAARRHLDLGVTRADEAELLRFRYDGRQPVRHTVARASLGPARAPHTPASSR